MSTLTYKYTIENGTGMTLGYACSPVLISSLVERGVISRSSPAVRLKHGVNPSFTMYSSSPALRCTLWSIDTPEKPAKSFTLFGASLNFITLLCPTPFEEVCNPVDTILAGRWLPYVSLINTM